MTDDLNANRPWSAAHRIGFRFALLYLSLYSATSIVGRWISPLVTWIAERLFGVSALPAMTGSGDRPFDWVVMFLVLTASVVGTFVWSVLDQRHTTYDQLDRRLRVFVRFALGWELVNYGAMKLIPVHMPYPMLTRLLEPYGHFSMMGVLWASIGASPSYERFVGGVEFMAGLLLFLPVTSLLGAIVAFVATAQVFVLNMTYDVPVKLFSFHLVLMSLFLLLPHLRALAGVLFAQSARKTWSTMLQTAIGVALAGVMLHHAAKTWGDWGGGIPKPPLYGIWDVDVMRLDGTDKPPLVTDPSRWRRVIIQNGATIVFWRMDDTSLSFGATYGDGGRTLAVQGRHFNGTFAVDRRDATHLNLDGRINGRAIHLEMTRVDESQFRLTARGFHWVQESPVNQ